MTSQSLLDLLTLASRLDQSQPNGQPSELDKLVTIAKMAAAQLSAEAPSASVSVPMKPELSTYANSTATQQAGTALVSAALSRGGLPLMSSSTTAPIMVQDPTAVNVLSALVSQLQQKQINETPLPATQAQTTHLPPPPPLKPREQASLQLLPLNLPALQSAQMQQSTQQQLQQQHQQELLRHVSQLQYPLLQMAPATSNASNGAAAAMLAPLGSVAVNGTPLHLNAYAAGHGLAGHFPPSMTLVQPVAQGPMAQAATLLPAQHLTNDLLLKLEQLSQANSLAGLAAFQPAPSPATATVAAGPTMLQYQHTEAPAVPTPPSAVSGSVLQQSSDQAATSSSVLPESRGVATPGAVTVQSSKPWNSASAGRDTTSASGEAAPSTSRWSSKRRKMKTIRKSSHNVIEARYRLSINDRIKELRRRVAGNDAKVQKSAVLQLTLDKLRNVDDENDNLRDENAALKGAHNTVVMQIQNMQSQLQAAGLPVDPGILEACRLPEIATRPLEPRFGSTSDAGSGREDGQGDDEFDDFNEDGEEDEEDDDLDDDGEE